MKLKERKKIKLKSQKHTKLKSKNRFLRYSNTTIYTSDKNAIICFMKNLLILKIVIDCTYTEQYSTIEYEYNNTQHTPPIILVDLTSVKLYFIIIIAQDSTQYSQHSVCGIDLFLSEKKYELSKKTKQLINS